MNGARAVVDAHEGGLDPAARRRHGAHYTPADLADHLVSLAIGVHGGVPEVVCDPCCGAGSFLLAAADALHRLGVPAAEAVGARIVGADIDPAAVGSARRALVQWARERGVARPPEPRVAVADTLVVPPDRWLPAGAQVDLLVGNPPFLGQLRTDTARDERLRTACETRFGALGAYADTAAIHLLSALEVAPSGVVCLVQPQSFLGSRDTRAVRRAIGERARLAGLWASDLQPFDAAVQVCAPVIDTRPGVVGRTVWTAWRDQPLRSGTAMPRAESWSPLLAACTGVPEVPPLLVTSDSRGGRSEGGDSVGDVARVTAGFRDEFYALAAAADQGADGPRLVTAGMIDPFTLQWAQRSSRLAGRRFVGPRLDLGALGAESPGVRAWVRARSVPKVLVATQTKVIEAVVDPEGTDIPVTPVISVEPTTEGVTPWMLAAAIAGPSVSAALAAHAAGTGRSAASIRVRAADIASIRLPGDPLAWGLATDAVRDGAPPRGDGHGWRRLGRLLDAAHGVDDEDVVQWWLDRLPHVP